MNRFEELFTVRTPKPKPARVTPRARCVVRGCRKRLHRDQSGTATVCVWCADKGHTR
jgi:hypothetical protein